MNFYEFAVELASLGYNVFPLLYNGKQPSTHNGCIGATTDLNLVNSWFNFESNYPNNIGVGCQNIYVIDIDVKNGNGIQDIYEMEKELGTLPKECIVSTPSGGKHLYFKKPDGDYIGQVAIEWHGRKTSIDIRTGNQYVVAPPSIINGKSYQWETKIPERESLPNLPDKWQKFLPQRREGVSNESSNSNSDNTEIIQVVKPTITLKGRELERAIYRCSQYIKTVDPAVQGNAGQTQMFRVINEIFVGFLLPIDKGMPILMEYNNRCVPPWDMSNPGDVRWINYSINRAINNPIEEGKLLNAKMKPRASRTIYIDSSECETKIGSDENGYEFDSTYDVDFSDKFNSYFGLDANSNKDKNDEQYNPQNDSFYKVERSEDEEFTYTPSNDIIKLENAEEARMNKKYNDKKKKAKYSTEDVRGLVKTSLLSMPGFVNTCLGVMHKYAPTYNHHVCFAGALMLLSTLIGPKIRHHGLFANLYTIALASSGSGKDFPRKFNKKVLSDVYTDVDVIGRTFTSGEALEDEILKNNIKLYQVDECDFLFKSISASKEAFQRSIQSNMLELYTSVDSIWSRRDNATGVNANVKRVCYNPYFNLFGTAPPEHYYNSLSSRVTEGGLFGRLTIFKAGQGEFCSDKDGNIPDYELENIKDFANWLKNYRPDEMQEKFFERTSLINPLDIPATKESELLVKNFATECRLMATQRDSTETEKSTYNRAIEKVFKFALLYEVSRKWKELLKTKDVKGNIDNDKVRQILVIDETATMWAINMVKSLVCIQLEDIDTMFYENTHDKNVKDVFNIISKTARRSTLGICKQKVILKSMPGLTTSDVEKIIADLVNQEKIESVDVVDKKEARHFGWRPIEEEAIE